MSQAATPEICYLAHAGFHMLGHPVFRLSEGAKIPSMVIQLESQDAVLPLRSLAREFKVLPESADGKMLELIERALDFVVCIRLGEKFPSEISGGEASWAPTEQDRVIAGSRVRTNLLRSVGARTGSKFTIDGSDGPGWEQAPKNAALVKQAIEGVVTLLDGVDAAEVTKRVALIAEEVAYIESMRRTLTKGITGLRDKLLRVPLNDVPIGRQPTVKQVQSLARRGLSEISNRFNEFDVRLDDLLAMIRDPTAATAYIRRQRDWFFRTNTAWTTVLNDWNSAPSHYDEFLWKVVERTYMFLAPRFMPFTEWVSAQAKMKSAPVAAKVW